MRTDTLSAFADELDKIAEVNLLGVSPEKVLTQQTPPPLETDGTRKAMSILDKAEMFKTASKKKDRSKPGGVMHHRLPMLGFLGATPSGVTPNGWDELKSTGAHGLAGAGVGRFISEFSSEAPTQAKKFKYTRAGLALGLADNAYKRYRKRKAKKTKTAAASDEEKTGRKRLALGAAAGAAMGAPLGYASGVSLTKDTLKGVKVIKSIPGEPDRLVTQEFIDNLAHGVGKGRIRTGAAIGAGLGLGAGYLYHRSQKKKTAGTLGLTPGQALKAGRQVGTHSGAIKSGPSIKSQIRGSLVGRRGALPF